jgi:hypothetical protein
MLRLRSKIDTNNYFKLIEKLEARPVINSRTELLYSRHFHTSRNIKSMESKKSNIIIQESGSTKCNHVQDVLNIMFL